MCLAIPGKLESINENNTGIVDVLGVKKEVALDLVPTCKIDDFVLIHAGYAIDIIDEKSAQETLDLLNEIPGLLDTEIAKY
ncbi:MAG: HypC/HybG/HupF family hydrogenase formation chaperone [Coriobacteriales bacterium]|nr:HypC/HybG/HupF family hydrogenase formation chaperone [Coriobacteriales bacterium]